MKLVEEIEKLNLLSDNRISIDEAVLKKISKKLSISFVLQKAVSLNVYNKLMSSITDLLKPLDLELEISIGYEDDSLTEEEYKKYLDEVLKVLISSSARLKALSVDDCRFESHKLTFLVAYDALGVDDLCIRSEERR